MLKKLSSLLALSAIIAAPSVLAGPAKKHKAKVQKIKVEEPTSKPCGSQHAYQQGSYRSVIDAERGASSERGGGITFDVGARTSPIMRDASIAFGDMGLEGGDEPAIKASEGKEPVIKFENDGSANIVNSVKDGGTNKYHPFRGSAIDLQLLLAYKSILPTSPDTSIGGGIAFGWSGERTQSTRVIGEIGKEQFSLWNDVDMEGNALYNENNDLIQIKARRDVSVKNPIRVRAYVSMGTSFFLGQSVSMRGFLGAERIAPGNATVSFVDSRAAEEKKKHEYTDEKGKFNRAIYDIIFSPSKDSKFSNDAPIWSLHLGVAPTAQINISGVDMGIVLELGYNFARSTSSFSRKTHSVDMSAQQGGADAPKKALLAKDAVQKLSMRPKGPEFKLALQIGFNQLF